MNFKLVTLHYAGGDNLCIFFNCFPIFFQISNALTAFADAFQHFQSSGLEHLAASNNIVKSMHELSALTGNSRDSSISSLFSRVSLIFSKMKLSVLYLELVWSIVFVTTGHVVATYYRRYNIGVLDGV